MNFDEYQKQVILSNENLLVIAGPGSGKTTTILAKVKHLLKTCKESDILLISFTNKSVTDIKNKINNNIQVTTFHKLAIDILKYNKISFKICDTYLLDKIIDNYILNLNDNQKKNLTKYLNIKELNFLSSELISFKRLIKTFINLYKTNNHNKSTLNHIQKEYQDLYLLNIIEEVMNIYEKAKQKTLSYDFDDLIILATKVLKENYNYKSFKHIIVDEFQDTSLIRLNLIKIIYENNVSTITAVGDDAQSIFHFTGCDLNIFMNFNTYFPNSKTIYLKYTYRYSQELINITEKFINKNPIQMRKNMLSNYHNKPLKIIYYTNPSKCLEKLLKKFNTNETYIIVRNKSDLTPYESKNIKIINSEIVYKEKYFKWLTIHSSKGLENKYIIILNVSDNLIGIPNKLENHPIIKYVESKIDAYPYAEERRIFFVALTRCKEKTYLLVPRKNPSIFIKEIKKCKNK